MLDNKRAQGLTAPMALEKLDAIRSKALAARALARRLIRAVPTPAPSHLVEFQRPWFQAHGIRTVIDVGANEGQFSAVAREAFPSAAILAFEPLPDCYETLRGRFASDQRFKAFQLALGDREGKVDMHRSSFSQSSSLLPMADAHREAFPYSAGSSEVSVPVRTLDATLADHALEEPLLLKIDVQGFEKQVLAGATRTLARTRFALMEMSLVKLYEGGPLFEEMYDVMRASGFRIASTFGPLRHPETGQPLQVDTLFAR